MPRRSTRKYCSDECRRLAFEARAEADAPAVSSAGLARGGLEAALRTERIADREPSPAEEQFVRALARVREADELVRLWTLRAAARRERLRRLERPPLELRLQVVRNEAEREVLLPQEHVAAVACSTGDLAVVVYGRPAAASSAKTP